LITVAVVVVACGGTAAANANMSDALPETLEQAPEHNFETVRDATPQDPEQSAVGTGLPRLVAELAGPVAELTNQVAADIQRQAVTGFAQYVTAVNDAATDVVDVATALQQLFDDASPTGGPGSLPVTQILEQIEQSRYAPSIGFYPTPERRPAPARLDDRRFD
jgi:hypothetical protein